MGTSDPGPQGFRAARLEFPQVLRFDDRTDCELRGRKSVYHRLSRANHSRSVTVVPHRARIAMTGCRLAVVSQG